MDHLVRHPLSPGQSVFVIAPGMPFDRDSLLASQKVLESWGLKVILPKGLLGKDTLCANNLKARLQQFREAVVSEASVIWAARGGYGSLQLLPGLQKIKRPLKSKWLVGFSDITTLHQFVQQEWGWSSLHGYHADRLALLKPRQRQHLHDILFGEKKRLQYKGLKPLNDAARKNHRLDGSLIGGNLTVLQSTFATPWQLTPQGKILFVEDLGERGYRVDRILTQMELMGLCKSLKAIVFGQFTGGNEPDGSNKVLKVIHEFANRQKIPVWKGLKVGHGPDSLCMPLNTKMRIYPQGSSTVLEVETGVK